MTIQQNQKGIVLLTSLMIMLIMTASGIALSTFIIRSLQSTRNTYFASTAYYAAESAVERSLFTARQSRLSGNSLDQTISILDSLSGSLEVPGLAFTVDATADNSGTVETTLAKNETYTIDLYNVDASLQNTGVRKVEIDWESVDQSEWIEVSWVGWKSDGTFVSNNEHLFFSAADRPQVINIFAPNGAVATRLRVKALKSPVNHLTITTQNGLGQTIDIPSSRLLLTATGTYQTSKQAIASDIRWQLPLSPLFDYAIFSEESIVK